MPLDRLILIRHAKSSWADSSMRDHERPLNGRGRRSAKAMGQTLRAKKWTPDHIWSSDSQRTKETVAGLNFNTADVTWLPGFYHAGMRQVLDICHQLGEPSGTLMLVGHNPGWSALYRHFTGGYHDYPTAATTLLTREGGGHWLSGDSWSLKELILPRELGIH